MSRVTQSGQPWIRSQSEECDAALTPLLTSVSSCERAYGLARCIWRGLNHLRAYVWSSVVAYNLALFTRLRST
ncbi:MAG: hypothetical protein E5X53_33180 [Mesorhizobium sp.]|uniref:hypothetical protein n=1 Tax=Mesorhizobium sp. TaxID=1871066 RepID=UPI00121F7D87|nr:hypothetical protein [Mesorhizobium sp.]TIP72237.1 MAG: hypothetical protein E5X55_18620 [Mesorhizobium sp.]TIR47619.1 MAG: hypothetical protein E5X53_33180 [Mesorhizobium sp.]TJV92860.1 MAG: hypothetical protein E5X52_32760 [Mesorhizobium sp.]